MPEFVDRAGRARQRILREVAGRQLERPAIVHRLGVRAVDVEQRAGVGVAAVDVAVEARRRRSSGSCRPRPRARAASRVMTLTTPLIALAPHTADAGPRITSICRISFGIGGHEVPHHHAEEIEVDAAAVDERQLRRRQRGRGAAGREVDVARRDLRHVEAGHRPQQVADVGGRRVLDRLAGDER